MKWTEVNVALLSFFSCVPTLSNVETDALTNTAQSPRYIDYNDGKHTNNSEEPQEHRLAEALSMMLVWWSHIEPALALPYADGLVKLHTATNNNHARVLSLVAKARLTGALATRVFCLGACMLRTPFVRRLRYARRKSMILPHLNCVDTHTVIHVRCIHRPKINRCMKVYESFQNPY